MKHNCLTLKDFCLSLIPSNLDGKQCLSKFIFYTLASLYSFLVSTKGLLFINPNFQYSLTSLLIKDDNIIRSKRKNIPFLVLALFRLSLSSINSLYSLHEHSPPISSLL